MKNTEKNKLIIIGGNTKIPGWVTMNADPATDPDILSDICELKGIENNSVSVFYLSHVLEHIRFPQVIPTLNKLYKAMNENSSLFISVPDLTTLGNLLHDKDLNNFEKIHVLRMIYGGQISDFDYHYFGYTFEILSAILQTVGFVGIRKVDEFNLHIDTSSFSPYKNTPISLNVVCHKS
jgi:predicted SAM-dependent methyltransferase